MDDVKVAEQNLGINKVLENYRYNLIEKHKQLFLWSVSLVDE